METIVYLLGAGFSAPLGMPVMSNFLEKAKDQYFATPGRYDHFREVLDTIREMHFAKGFYETDLLNIEEVLSILDMEHQVGGRGRRESIVKFICDVIGHHTPAPPEIPKEPTGLDAVGMMCGRSPWREYGAFAASLAGMQVAQRRTEGTNVFIGYQASPQVQPNVRYGVITLNYDAILELALAAFNTRCLADVQPTDSADDFEAGRGLSLAKIHGDAQKGVIVPPTWSKALTSEMQAAWSLAYRMLSTATQIRILGYSLPPTDSYIKYLLRAAAVHSEHLKRIDVACLDPDGTVRSRYEEFISFRRKRVESIDLRRYLELVAFYATTSEPLRFDGIERAHESVFGS
jgi:hypothetical protein